MDATLAAGADKVSVNLTVLPLMSEEDGGGKEGESGRRESAQAADSILE